MNQARTRKPTLEKKSLSRLIWDAAKRDVFLGVPWVPIYAASQVGMAFLIGAIISLMSDSSPRISVMSRVPPEFQEFFHFGQTLDRKTLVFAIPLLLIAFATTKLLSGFASNYFIERSGHRVSHVLREKLLEGFLAASGNVLDRKNPDEVANRLLTDSATLQGTISRGLVSLLRDSLVLIGIVLSVFRLAFGTTMILLLAAIPIALIIKSVSHKLAYYAKESVQRQVQLSTRLLQTKNGLLTVFGLRTQERELYDLNQQSSGYYEFIKGSFLVRTFFRPTTEFFAVALLAAFFHWRFQSTSEFPSATYSTLLVLMAMAFAPLKNLSNLIAQWTEIRVVYARLKEQWNSYRQSPCVQNFSFLDANSSHALVVDSASYHSSKGVVILENCSLRIKKGCRVAFVGESGSGKTTFLRLCAGLLSASKGKISIEQSFLLATQTPYIFKGSVNENICYANTSIPPQLLRHHVDSLLLALSLAYSETGAQLFADKKVGYLGAGLSGGERARVALARILLESPKLLLLDEPTANLDAESSKAFWKAVREWQEKDKERTLITVLHAPATLDSWDMICEFSEGKIIRITKEGGEVR